jgi:hypothetical protein
MKAGINSRRKAQKAQKIERRGSPHTPRPRGDRQSHQNKRGEEKPEKMSGVPSEKPTCFGIQEGLKGVYGNYKTGTAPALQHA